MAQRVQVDEIKERFGRLIRHAVRLAPIVVIVFAIAWFFLLRSPGEQTDTTGTAGTTPETVSTETPTQPQTKVADNSKSAEAAKEESKAKEEGKLPETGPADTAAIVAITALAGTLFWEWRLRRAARPS